ncbi:MAG TPA: copper chaperone PCu(A)C [Steroidobacteraceae bacterium]|jgi:copper(I)-binding protein
MHSRHIVLAARVLVWMSVSAGALGAPPASAVQVRDAWVRWLPGNLPAGGYLTLVNSGDQPSSLIAASCPDYADVSLHRSRTVAGTSQMTPVDKITVAAHSRLEFAAQGYHLMLAHPRKALRPGDRVPVTLSFAGGPAVTVEFALRPPAAGGDMSDMPGMSQ